MENGDFLTKISIIIPVYNTASYLDECLKSVLGQTFQDIEIICINDGSTDNSLEILEKYPVKIINQENQGQSASRNNALKEATGEYILFLDSDDYLEENTLMELYEIMESKSLDLLIFKIIDFDNETRELSKYSYFEMDLLKDRVGDDVFCYSDVKDLLFRISVTAPGKLYRRDLIEDIRFNEGLIFEDNAFFMEMFIKTKRVYFKDKYYYFRRIHKDSTIQSNFEKFSDVIPIYNIINDIIIKSGEYDEVKHKLFNRQCRDIFLRFSQVPEELKADFFDEIKRDFENKMERYENDGSLDLANKRSREIFFSAINSKTHEEFELSIEIFDLKREINKLQKENNKLAKKIPKSTNPLKKLFKH